MGTNYPNEIDILSLAGTYGLRLGEQSDSQNGTEKQPLLCYQS